MKQKVTEVAFCYDFDGTLAAGNMQEYGFMSRLGVTPAEFWAKVDAMTKEYAADNNLMYMKHIEDTKLFGIINRKIYINNPIKSWIIFLTIKIFMI